MLTPFADRRTTNIHRGVSMLLDASPRHAHARRRWLFLSYMYCVGMARCALTLAAMATSYKTPACSKNTRTAGQLRLIGAG